jgi:hypothetical protein
MSDAKDLARRYLALWEDYLTALLTDPAAQDLLQGWAPASKVRDSTSKPETGAAPLAGASGECCSAVAELARRIAGLEDRLAAVERRGPAPARPRRRDRRMRV